MKLEYDYGTNTQNNGSLRSQKISFSGLSQPFEQTYIYDDLNRLQSAEEKVSTTTTWKQTFTYDRYGNRRFDAANTTTLAASNNVTNPTIDTATNRFSSGQNYSYDKDGNLTVDAENRRFVYDAENHQTQLFASNNSSSTPDATYHYDGEGRRVKKISSTETTVFVYDGGGQLVAEYSTQLAETPQVSYLTSDHLGSPRVITNQLGAVTTRKDYMAFGEETYTTQRTSSLNYDNQSETRKGYTGYEKDDESGLDFAQARYYNSKHGRFTSVDPLMASANVKNPQTFNRYSYVLNSPYKFTDPLGLLSEQSGSACGNRCQNSDGGMAGYSDNYDSGHRAGREGSIIEEALRWEAYYARQPWLAPGFVRLSDPKIVVTGVSLVTQGAKTTPGGTVILDKDKKPIIEDTTLATGVSLERSPDTFDLNLNNAESSFLLGEVAFIKVEVGIAEVGEQERAVFGENSAVLRGNVISSIISDDGRTMTVYIPLRAPDGLTGKRGSVALTVMASYIDQYDSSSNKVLVDKTVIKTVNIRLTNTPPVTNPSTNPFKKKAYPF